MSGLTETGNGEGEDAEGVDGSEGEDGDEESSKKKRKVRFGLSVGSLKVLR